VSLLGSQSLGEASRSSLDLLLRVHLLVARTAQHPTHRKQPPPNNLDPRTWCIGSPQQESWRIKLLKIMHGESYACMRHEVWINVDRTASHHIGASQRCVPLLMLAMKL
jgi:hypothetical protein